jgi:hypothetical protein
MQQSNGKRDKADFCAILAQGLSLAPFRSESKYEILAGEIMNSYRIVGNMTRQIGPKAGALRASAFPSRSLGTRFCMRIFLIILSFFCFQADVQCAVYEADYVPWSGYWWPKTYGGLVNGSDYRKHPAPLEKYDRVTNGTYNGPATRYGSERYYDPEAVEWAGLCFPWAAASIMEEEPVHMGVYKGISFYVGDKKALLTVAYNGALYNDYPIQSPEDFHRILEEFIAKQKIPVIMDLGTDGESWNYPVFKYETDYTQKGNIRHYTTHIYFVRDEVSPDYIGAKIDQNCYTYYFLVDEAGNITESRWEGESALYPPINAAEPFGTEPINPGVTYEQIKEIVKINDDPYEENDFLNSAVLFVSGHYPLIARDSDYFKIELKKGDKLNIRVDGDPQADDSEEPETYLKTYTPEGLLIESSNGIGEQVITAGITGTYFFEILPQPWTSRDYIYHLFLQHNLAYQGLFPVYPGGQWCNGMAMLTAADLRGFQNLEGLTDEGRRMIVSLMDAEGFPKTSYSTATSRRQLSGTISGYFGLPPVEGTEYIRLDSDVPFQAVQIGVAGDLMSGANFTQFQEASAEIFFPRFENMGWLGGWQTEFGIINTGDQTEEVIRESYDKNGEFLSSDTLTLAPGQKAEDDYLEILANAETMTARATSGRACLTGYIHFRNGSGGAAMTPLISEKETPLIIPYIPSDDQWRTNITLMNAGETDSAVTFSAYDEDGNLISIADHRLKAKQNFIKDISEILDGNGDIKSVKINGDEQPLCGLVLYESQNQLAGIPLRSLTSPVLYLPHVPCTDAWWTGIGVMNTGDSQTDIALSLFNGKGELLDVITKALNPNQRLSGAVTEFFGEDTSRSARYMKIESAEGQPLSGMYLIGSNDGRQLMGDLMGIEE